MPEPKKSKPMMCQRCGVAMNHHAEKLLDPRDAREAARMDPGMGGMIEEVHTCPECGEVASRPGA